MIRNLRIEFRHMMVFYGEAAGMTVLLPVFEHTATLTQHAKTDRATKTATLDRAIVQILRDGQPLRGGGPVVCDRGGYLVHAREAIGAEGDVPPKPDLLQGQPPVGINARIHLPGPGRLDAREGECERYPPAANARWNFLHRDGHVHTQRLSDRIDYVLRFDDEHEYAIRVTSPTVNTTFNLSEGTGFIVSNADDQGKAITGPFNQLTEFPKLYGLLDLPGSLQTYSFPPPKSHDLPPDPPPVEKPGDLTPDVACCDPLICGETHE